MDQYYYSDGQSQFGPVSKEELLTKGITKETLVWYEGLADWIKAGDSKELEDLFPKVPTPPPLPKAVTPPPIPREETVAPPPIPEERKDIMSESEQPMQNNGETLTEETESPNCKSTQVHSLDKTSEISIPKANTPPPQKNNKGTIVVISIVLIIVAVLALIIGISNEQQQRKYYQKEFYHNQQIDGEKNYPTVYLSIVDYSLENARTLKVTIQNGAKYTTYKKVALSIEYYGQYGDVLPCEDPDYLVDGNFAPNSKVSIYIKIKSRSILKKALKNGRIEVKITGAVPAN